MQSAHIQPTARIEPFKRWLKDRGVSWHALRFVAYDVLGNMLALESERDITEGDTLCVIPNSAIISIHNSSIKDVIEKEMLGGGLGLTLAVMHERAIGEHSIWYATWQH
jgi:N-lysine methyltransferase SETD6